MAIHAQTDQDYNFDKVCTLTISNIRITRKLNLAMKTRVKRTTGLDKLVILSTAQNNTDMKDFISYQLMNAFGADCTTEQLHRFL